LGVTPHSPTTNVDNPNALYAIKNNLMKNFEKLDYQMKQFKQELIENVFIKPNESEKLATELSLNFVNLKKEILNSIKENDKIPFIDRYHEFISFQGMMDFFNSNETVFRNPKIVRMQVISQNYISFTYFNEIIYHAVKKMLPTESVGKKCIHFITTGKIRLFRNAFSHGNWKYNKDFVGLTFYARLKKQDKTLSEFNLSDFELNFWQSLSRTINYTLLESLKD
jgi:hypothetical protein